MRAEIRVARLRIFRTVNASKVSARPPRVAHHNVAPADIVWLVGTGCQVSVRVQNLLPVELVVRNLTLHTEGAAFEAIPVRLNLAPAALSAKTAASHEGASGVDGATDSGGSGNLAAAALANAAMATASGATTSASGDVALLGVPRAAGTLTLTGYSCEVFGVESVCALRAGASAKAAVAASSTSRHVDGPQRVNGALSVRVLPLLPRLQLAIDCKRAPVDLNEAAGGGVAEVSVYSGQT